MVEKPNIAPTRANVANFNNYLKVFRTMLFENMAFTKDMKQTLSRAMKLQSFDYLQSDNVQNDRFNYVEENITLLVVIRL